jgi:hypothetical protein
MVECKAGSAELSENIPLFQNILKIPAVQLVDRPGIHRRLSNGEYKTLIVSAPHWLAGLP